MADSRMHGIFGALLKEKQQLSDTASSSGIPVTDDVEETVEMPNLSKGQIAVDIFEEEGFIIIKAPIAGVKLSDLDIDVTDNEVIIRGRRQQTDIVDKKKKILEEIHWGDFERTVTLPCSVNANKVRATFSKDNILKVFIPKEGGRKVKIVKINEGG